MKAITAWALSAVCLPYTAATLTIPSSAYGLAVAHVPGPYANSTAIASSTEAIACTPNTVFVSLTYTTTVTASTESTPATSQVVGLTGSSPTNISPQALSTILSTSTRYVTHTNVVTVQQAPQSSSESEPGYSMIVASGTTSWFENHTPGTDMSLTTTVETLTTTAEPTKVTTITIAAVDTWTETITEPAFTSTLFSYVADPPASTTTTHITRISTLRQTTTVSESQPRPSFSGMPSDSLGWNNTVSEEAASSETTITGEPITITGLTVSIITSTTTSTRTNFTTTTMTRIYSLPLTFVSTSPGASTASQSESVSVASQRSLNSSSSLVSAWGASAQSMQEGTSIGTWGNSSYFMAKMTGCLSQDPSCNVLRAGATLSSSNGAESYAQSHPDGLHQTSFPLATRTSAISISPHPALSAAGETSVSSVSPTSHLGSVFTSTHSRSFDTIMTTTTLTPKSQSPLTRPTSSTCGEIGEILISFDDLPEFAPSSLNDSKLAQAPPIFSPYHHLAFSSGFVYSPPPTEPYQPISGPNVGLFLPSNSIVAIPAPAILPGELGDTSAQESMSAFWFNPISAFLGCKNRVSSSECNFLVSAHRYNSGSRMEMVADTENYTIEACTDPPNCRLQQINFPASFYNLTGLQIQAYMGKDQVMWFMDDLHLSWSNTTCAAGLIRERSP